MPKVSVLIPLYNCEKTVRRSIASIRSQTYRDFEVIAVDNNCTDKTINIVKEFSDDFELKVIKCPEKGIVPALNTGLRACTGDWKARQDGDDYWYPEKLQKQMEFLSNNPDIDILGTQIRLIDENGNVQSVGTMGKEIYYPTEDHEIKGGLLYGQNTICHPSVIFRKSVINVIGGYERFFPLAEDLHFWCRAFPHFRFANVDEVLVDYTQKYDDTYDARIPLLIGDTYYNLYKTAGLVVGEREQKVYDWQLDPNSHGRAKGRR